MAVSVTELRDNPNSLTYDGPVVEGELMNLQRLCSNRPAGSKGREDSRRATSDLHAVSDTFLLLWAKSRVPMLLLDCDLLLKAKQRMAGEVTCRITSGAVKINKGFSPLAAHGFHFLQSYSTLS